MLTLSKEVKTETVVKGSRFLAELIPCQSQAEAREIIRSQKSKYADSTHVVHAFAAGKKAEILGMSDDGEPGGTAGRPVLDVLKGSGCTNAILTVTRWFGGTLLGTGGLVKAYGNAAKDAIEKARTENAFEELVEKSAFSFSTDYSMHKVLKNRFEDFHLYDVKKDFGAEIIISGNIRSDEFDEFSEMVNEVTNGKGKVSSR